MNLRQVGWITEKGALHTFGVHEKYHRGLPCEPVYVVEGCGQQDPDAGTSGSTRP